MNKSIARHIVYAVVVLACLVVWKHKVSPGKDDSKPFLQLHSSREKPLSERKRRLSGRIGQNAPDRFAAYHRAIRTRYGESAPAYPPNYQVAAWAAAWERAGIRYAGGKRSAIRNPLPWIERGPINVAGRARAVLVDPTDFSQQTWLIGSAGGGVWKTSDAGETWVELTADLPNLATTTLAMPRSNPDVIYAGTGEGYGSFSFVYGQGIWKSTDGGNTWAHLPRPADARAFTNILRLIVDPDDDRVVIVAASSGNRHGSAETSSIYRSEDGGFSWERTYMSEARVEQVVSAPGNFSTQYAAVNGRGVLKSTDGGRTWASSFEDFAGVGRIELAIAPTDPSRLYASVENAAFASTLYHSPDAGETWEVMSDLDENNLDWLQEQGWYNNAVAVDPFDADVVYVGGVDLMRYDVGPDVIELGVIKSVIETDPHRFFTVDKAISAPETAAKLERRSLLSSAEFRSVEIRWGPDRSQKVHRFTGKWFETYQDYVEAPFEVWDLDANRQLMAVYEDTDQDSRWDIAGALLDASERIFVLAEPYDATTPNAETQLDAFSRAQYVLTVFSNDDDEVRHGPFPEASIQIHPDVRAFRAGTISRLTYGYGFAPDHPRGAHVDHHQLLLTPVNGTVDDFFLLDANDGGLAVSYDKGATFLQSGDTFAQIAGGGGTTHRPLSGLKTAQFYGVDKMNGANRFVGGTQDNGSWISRENAGPDDPWQFTPSGDGFESVWHYANPDWIIQSSQFNILHRSVDGGVSWRDVTPPGGGPFVTRIGRSAQRPDHLFVVNDHGVARSSDFGAMWEQVFLNEAWPDDAKPTVRVSLATPDVIWAGGEMSPSYTLHVSTDGGDSFVPVSRYESQQPGVVTDIATHPSEPNTAYALFSIAAAPKVLKTADLGASWEDLSGFEGGETSTNGFPDVAVYSLLVMPFDENRIWAGTEIGIFESVDGGVSWQYADNGLPAVAVWQMRIVNDQIVVATHGRGVWTVQLPELAFYRPANGLTAPIVGRVEGGIAGNLSMTIESPEAYDSVRVSVDGEIIATLTGLERGDRNTVVYRRGVDEMTEVDISTTGFLGGEVSASRPVRAELHPLRSTQRMYFTDFTDGEDAFLLDGFAITMPAGFVDEGLHSPHPYNNFQESSATLLVPILVDEHTPFLIFDEIVRMEAGEVESEFGDEEFYDAVMVEASEDQGVTWKTLDAYDVRSSETWTPGMDVRRAPQPVDFETRSVNLLDVFPAGSELIFRFRLLADNARTGWGWGIDNLHIQTALPTAGEVSSESMAFSLEPGYPNPFSESTTIVFSLPQPAETTLQVFDAGGRILRSLDSGTERPAGIHRLSWDGRNTAGVPVASGVYFYRFRAGKTFEATRQVVVVR